MKHKLKLLSVISEIAVQFKRKRTLCKQKATRLSDLPYDVILQVFLHLDFTDVLALQQVSRLFYDASENLMVWKNIAFKLMCRGRRISLHDQTTLSALSAKQIKRSVLLTISAEASWMRPTPLHVSCPRPIQLADVDLDHASYIMKFTSQRHLVLPTKGGELVGWDSRTSSFVGTYNMGAESVLINVQGVYETRSLYWITGKISSDPDHEQNLHIKILRIQFPEPSSSDPIIFEALGDLVTPWSLATELHFLDASRNMFCAVFHNEETGTAGLHVVLDWKTGLSYMLDTGIIYEYGRAVIGLHLSADKQSLIVRTEECGAEIRRAYSLREMQEHAFIWSNSRRPPRSLPMVQPAASALFHWQHEHSSLGFDMAPHTVWVLPQWWPTYSSVPRRTSTIILYLSVTDDAFGTTRRYWRAAQHYSDAVETAPEGGGEVNEKYATTSVWGCESVMEGGAPCSSARSVVDIGENAVTISLGQHGLPILAQSFNHLGWIEETVESEDESYFDMMRPQRLLNNASRRVSSLGRRSSFLLRTPPRRTRVLKLVTFPDPGVSPISENCKLNNSKSKRSRRQSGKACNCTTLQPVTLDVPSSLLENVYHMLLDPAAGTIMLATLDNELHVYHYGMPDQSVSLEEDRRQLPSFSRMISMPAVSEEGEDYVFVYQ